MDTKERTDIEIIENPRFCYSIRNLKTGIEGLVFFIKKRIPGIAI